MKILSILYYPVTVIEKMLNIILPDSFHPFTPFAALLLGIVIVTVLFFFIATRLNKKRNDETS